MIHFFGISKNHTIWDNAKKIRLNKDFSDEICVNGAVGIKNMQRNSLDLLNSLNFTINLDSIENIQKSTYENAFRLFVYLNFCPGDIIDSPWTKLTNDLFSNYSFQKIILFLNRVILTSNDFWANLILKSLTIKLDLQYNQIGSLAISGKNTNKSIESWSTVHEISDHPVHILRTDGTKSPSAFIPFCYFGEHPKDYGIKVDGFKYPVCNMFKTKVLNDQLCYEVDVNDLKIEKISDMDLRRGLTLLVDYNEDRQVDSNQVDDEERENVSELGGNHFS